MENYLGLRAQEGTYQSRKIRALIASPDLRLLTGPKTKFFSSLSDIDMPNFTPYKEAADKLADAVFKLSGSEEKKTAFLTAIARLEELVRQRRKIFKESGESYSSR